jgi:hypothetical protein
MDVANLVLGYIKVLIWPTVAFFALWRYRNVIRSLLPHTKVKFTFGGVCIETSVDTLERSVNESLHGRHISPDQWTWLKRLQDQGKTPYNHASDYDHLSPLRNSGLIREHPEGWLTDAKEIEITTLGRLLLEAHQRSSKEG